jgi:hypothetical protein
MKKKQKKPIQKVVPVIYSKPISYWEAVEQDLGLARRHNMVVSDEDLCDPNITHDTLKYFSGKHRI